MGAEVEQRRVYVLFATPTYRKTNGIDLSIRAKFPSLLDSRNTRF